MKITNIFQIAPHEQERRNGDEYRILKPTVIFMTAGFLVPGGEEGRSNLEQKIKCVQI